ncbi:MAG: hypothetical protein QOJ54_3554 [Aliidongia sp.]|jgi:hypothetical protein|nr:hypothetical protein [Aliidongia sp.]
MKYFGRMGKIRLSLFLVGMFGAGVIAAGIYDYAGLYGFNVILRRGSSRWIPVAADDARLSDAMRLAQHRPVPAATPGPLAWRTVADGFEVAELSAIIEGSEVDRILLARIDPAHFRFIVRNAPAGNRELGDWMQKLGAALVINGSYFSRHGTPTTPFLSAGIDLGPSDYAGSHGAFVASGAETAIHDLAGEDWQTAFKGADDALVSYPLLIGNDGVSRAGADTGWLANRSFVGQDKDGRLVFGTTEDAFFSLARLADFLHSAPLDLTLALNLDGGPVACQGIAVAGYRRDFCGKWEFRMDGDQPMLLTGLFGTRRWALPVVLAALPR